MGVLPRRSEQVLINAPTRATSSTRTRHWNFAGPWPERVPTELPVGISFICFQRERVEHDDGHANDHIQGYMQTLGVVRHQAARQLVADMGNLNVYPSHASGATAIMYCQKGETAVQGTYRQYGEPSRASIGKQNWEEFLAFLRGENNGGKVPQYDEVVEQFPDMAAKYSQMITRYTACKEKSTQRLTLRVTYIWGRSGAGKTRLAHQLLENTPHMIKVMGQTQWDGLKASDQAILIDELRGKSVQFPEMLRVCDVNKCTVNVKYSTAAVNVNTIIITSNADPSKVYRDSYTTEEDEAAWLRRIHNNFEFVDTNLFLVHKCADMPELVGRLVRVHYKPFGFEVVGQFGIFGGETEADQILNELHDQVLADGLMEQALEDARVEEDELLEEQRRLDESECEFKRHQDEYYGHIKQEAEELEYLAGLHDDFEQAEKKTQCTLQRENAFSEKLPLSPDPDTRSHSSH